MLASQKTYWFPAKRYGFGWGLPNCWQGWLALAAYLVSIPLLVKMFPPTTKLKDFLFGLAISTSLYLFICRRKGEPLHWHWG